MMNDNTFGFETCHLPYTECASISDDGSSDHSSSHFELSESEGRIWPDHANVVADGDC